VSVWKGVKYLWIAIGAVVVLWCCSIDWLPRGGDAKTLSAQMQIDHFLTALEAYRKDVGGFPSTDEGLQALRKNPGHAAWNGPYLAKDIPRDPWGSPYVYTYPGTDRECPDIVSYGADRRPGGEGLNADIVSRDVARYPPSGRQPISAPH
jgi:general secretion pathway protein G